MTLLHFDEKVSSVVATIGEYHYWWKSGKKWFVKEGDFVNKGDTILQLSEIKADYLDPRLVERTGEQITAKRSSVQFYQNKVTATENQIDWL